ncbi:hypothetical protein [Limosilactobacillus ingluviei]|uniref:hypothetical protein n=1 Tax=Limosilactobacillus ingluviei TaxID=148604 RepID=UPI0023F31D9A|nr:hypothetical protein [Limosilactobacillus ingluviei]
MESKSEYIKSLMKEINHIDAELEDLEIDLREHPEIDDDSNESWQAFKISGYIYRARVELLEIDKAARRLLGLYNNAEIGTYRKTATVKAERFWLADKEKLDYYHAKYGITRRDDLPVGDLNRSMGANVRYTGDDNLLPTLEGNMVIENGDWILTGINGEHWVVKDEIFNMTYKRVED